MSSKPSVLIVDDSHANRLMLEVLLVGLQLEVHQAANGDEAIALAQEQNLALIILDVDMPTMDGYQVLNRLYGEKATHTIPVIMVCSNYCDENDRLHQQTTYAVDVIHKPVNESILLRKVSAALSMWEQRQSVANLHEDVGAIFTTMHEGVLCIDDSGRIQYADPYSINLLDTSLSDLRGIYFETILEKSHHDIQSSWDQHILALACKGGKTVQVKHSIFWSAVGHKRVVTMVATGLQKYNYSGILLAFKEIEDEEQASKKLSNLSHRDHLTGLDNRQSFEDQLKVLTSMELDGEQKSRAKFAILFVGLDHFRNINDTLGHDLGDQLLKGVALRLTACIGSGGSVARLGGDEFSVLLNDMSETNQAHYLAQQIVQQIDLPFLLDGHEIFTSARIGIASYPECGDSVRSLMTNGDTALHRVKEQNQHRIQFYSEEMNRYHLQRLDLAAQFHHALENQEILIAKQQYADISSGEAASFALQAYWQHPSQGRLPLQQILPQATQTEAGLAVEKWVVERAVQLLQLDAHIDFLSLPLSLYYLQQEDSISFIVDLLTKNAVAASRFRIELDESELVAVPVTILAQLENLTRQQIPLILSRFGSGNAAIGLLRQIEFCAVKLDQNWLQLANQDPKERLLMHSLVRLVHDLGLNVLMPDTDLDLGSGEKGDLVLNAQSVDLPSLHTV